MIMDTQLCCIIDYLQNDIIEGKWLMKVDVEMAAQFDVPNDVRRNPTIAWRKSKNRRIEFLDILLINFLRYLPAVYQGSSARQRTKTVQFHLCITHHLASCWKYHLPYFVGHSHPLSSMHVRD